MTPETLAAYMETVREGWLQCRGPQRRFAKAWLASYDRDRLSRSRAIRKRWAAVLLTSLAISLCWYGKCWTWIRLVTK